MKHVFSAFTLYANVLRRVKVPFDEKPSRSSSERPFTGTCPPSPKKDKLDYPSFFVLFFLLLSGRLVRNLCFPGAGSSESTSSFLAYSPLCRHTGVGISDGAVDRRGRTRRKLMRQRRDGQRSESCIDNETLERNNPRTLLSDIPQPRRALLSRLLALADRTDDSLLRSRPLRRQYPNPCHPSPSLQV